MKSFLKYPGVILAVIVLIAGCSSPAPENASSEAEWDLNERGSGLATDAIGIRDISESSSPQHVSDSDFARELANMFEMASAEIAKLSTEANIAAEFPADASQMLNKSASLLEIIAAEGYEAFEMELIEDYKKYVSETLETKEGVDLNEFHLEGKAGTAIVDDDLIESDLETLKTKNWESELTRLKAELAAERCKFDLRRQSLYVTHSTGISSAQGERIELLEQQLAELAQVYAQRVSAAIDESMADSSLGIRYQRLTAVNYDEQLNELKTDFESNYEKVKKITGETQE